MTEAAAVVADRRDQMLKRIRTLMDDAEALAASIRCSDRLRDAGYAPVDVAEVDIAASHLKIGFITLARALFPRADNS